MNKKYLSVSLNNLLALVLGIPTLIYGIIKIQTGIIEFGSFLVLTIIGVLY